MAKRGEGKAPIEAVGEKVGTYVAYDKNGNELWRKEDFRIGHDSIPGGLSYAMGSMQIIDPKSGEVIAKWDPWSN